MEHICPLEIVSGHPKLCHKVAQRGLNSDFTNTNFAICLTRDFAALSCSFLEFFICHVLDFFFKKKPQKLNTLSLRITDLPMGCH